MSFRLVDVFPIWNAKFAKPVTESQLEAENEVMLIVAVAPVLGVTAKLLKVNGPHVIVTPTTLLVPLGLQATGEALATRPIAINPTAIARNFLILLYPPPTL